MSDKPAAPFGEVDDLLTRLSDEADLCRNEGAQDIAVLLDEAVNALQAAHAAAATAARNDALEEAARVCQREWQGANALYKSQVAGELMRAIRALMTEGK